MRNWIWMRPPLSLACLIVLTLTACASVQVYDMNQTQQTLSEAVQKNDAMVQKATADFDEKKRLIDNLSRTKSPAFRTNETELRSLLASMKTHLNLLESHRKTAGTANSELVALAYNRQEIRSNQPEHAQVQNTLGEFQKAIADSNQAMLIYSRESNALTDLVDKNKLLLHFDPALFVRRIQTSITNAQETSANFQLELDRAEQQLEQSQAGAVRRRLENISTSLQDSAQSYTARAQRLQILAKQMRDVTNDVPINSLDPEWPRSQSILKEYEAINAELAQTQAKFTATLENFRLVAREIPEN